MNQVFITGTDTDVGKTYISAAILHTLKHHLPDLALHPRKPIASGCQPLADGTLFCEDAHRLKAASGTEATLAEICPFQFEAAISPERAIRQSRKQISLANLAITCQAEKNGFTLVEGAGGFYSPIALDGLNADLAKALGCGVILVVGNRLGCLNQYLLSIAAIEAQGLTLLAVFVNDVNLQADYENYQDIASRCKVPCFHVPYNTENNAPLLLGLDKIILFRDLFSQP